MHIYFSAIGGAGIGPLAMVAQQAGYTVSGSDKQASQYIDYLKQHGVANIHIGQSSEQIAAVHAETPIDWYVYSSAVAIEQPDGPELHFCQEHGIKTTKRDELLNHILTEKQLQLIAVAGTHGKTTTTAMTVWLCQQLNIPVSYILPAKTSFADMGHFDPEATYFVYEADEFDRNFLAYHPFCSLITGVSWDHHEIFKTREEYQQAFRDFIAQSHQTYIWQTDATYLGVTASANLTVLNDNPETFESYTLPGRANKQDAHLVVSAVSPLTTEPTDKLIEHINRFPGLQRRMEQIVPGLYSDYAHTPEKIRGGLSVAFDIAARDDKQVVVVYEPLTNRRQHYMIDDYQDTFKGVKKLYWIPSYLAREDPDQPVLSPAELINHLSDPSIAEARERDESLKQTIQQHLDAGDMVVCMAGGGGNSLDEWLRREFHT